MFAVKALIGRLISCRSVTALTQSLIAKQEYHTTTPISANAANPVRSEINFTPKRTATGKGKNEDNNKRWWQSSFEFKIVALVATALTTHIMSQFFERRQTRKIIRLQHVNNQIEKLYGPLYGNRLVQEKVFQAVMGEYKDLKKYLKQAENTKDATMIHRWRSFLVKVLFPLDQEARTLIIKNGQLIVDNDFPPSFDHFLTHLAKLQFIMERWTNENGKLELMKDFTDDDYLEENNASGDSGVSEMFRHVEIEYKKLKSLQKQLEMEAQIDASSSKHLKSLNFLSKTKRLF